MKNQLLFLLLGISLCFSKPFSEKVFFSETPEMGKDWHGGIRSHDIISLDWYWNIAGWFTLDYMGTGLDSLSTGKNKGWVRDQFNLLTLKAHPFKGAMLNRDWAGSLGLKFFNSNFMLVDISDAANPDTMLSGKTSSVVIFFAQSLQLNKTQILNLFTSISSQEVKGEKEGISTLYFVPSWQMELDSRWSLAVEFYATNAIQLPGKILQYAFDPDAMEFYNPSRDWFSFLIWGIRYQGEHFFFDAALLNHYSFTGIILPVLGLGWNF